MSHNGLFVGVGVSTYDEHAALPEATRELTELVELVSQTLTSRPLLDPAAADVWNHLEALQDEPLDGTLVLYWSGHAVVSASGELRLLARDSADKPRAGMPVREVILQSLHGDLSQVLIIIDTCFSGVTADLVAQVAAEILQESQDAARVWVGVLASCQPFETAKDGAFGRHLIDLIRSGPADRELARAWSVRNRWLKGDDLGNAVLETWQESTGQRPVFRREGLSGPVLPNPRFDEAARPQIVEHLLRAARGGGDGDRSWFTGRRQEVDSVVAWVTAGVPGTYVVTGSAGTGKSAITGRVVSVATSGERARLLEQGELGHLDPGEGSVDAHAHLRGLTTDGVARDLDRQLVDRGILPADSRRSTAADLLMALTTAKPEHAPVIVLDGLDEAGGQAFRIATEVVLPLSVHAVVIMSTRNRISESSDQGQQRSFTASPAETDSLVASLHPRQLLDLDDPAWRRSGQRARAEYIERRLAAAPRLDDSFAMDVHAIADFAGGDEHDDEPFLVARLLVDQLLATPVDTSSPDWRDRVRTSIDDAMRAELATVPAPDRALPEQITPALFGETLLTALTWGLGAGLPEEEWIAVATALLDEQCVALGVDVPEPVTSRDVSWVLSHLGRFIVEDGEAGVAVFRMSHQSLADQLRSRFQPSDEQPFDPTAGAVSRALAGRYADLLAAGVPATAPVYLFRYCYYHAALAGPTGVDDLRRLAEIDPTLAYDVALAQVDIGRVLADLRRYDLAADCSTDAIKVLRGLDLSQPGYTQKLGEAETCLGLCLWHLDRADDALASTVQAAAIAKELLNQDPSFAGSVAMTTYNLSLALTKAGRLPEALAHAFEAEYRYREVAVSEPDALTDHADALLQLAESLEGLDQSAAALDVRQRLWNVLFELGEQGRAEPEPLASLARDIGRGWQRLERYDAAVEALRRAVHVYRGLGAEHGVSPLVLPDTLDDLGRALFQQQEGLDEPDLSAASEAFDEAATLLRPQLDADDAVPVMLREALYMLTMCLIEKGDPGGALEAAEEALALDRDRCPVDEDQLSRQAEVSQVRAISLAELGRPQEAIDRLTELVGQLCERDVETEQWPMGVLIQALRRRSALMLERGSADAALTTCLEALTVVLDRRTGLTRLRDLYDVWADVRAAATAAGPESAATTESAWTDVVRGAADDERAVLLVMRAIDEPGTAAAAWLAESVAVLEQGGPDLVPVLVDARDAVRRQRALDHTALDDGWRLVSGGPLPDWSMIDEQLLASARSWVAAPTYPGEREVLREHPELLSVESDAAVDEALLGVHPGLAEHAVRVREAARVQGVDAAYAAVVAPAVAASLISAHPAEVQSLLIDQVVDLDAVRAALLSSDTPDRARLVALVDLVATPDGRTAVAALASATQTDTGAEGVFWSTARDDPAALGALIELFVLLATPGVDHAIALLLRAVAHVITTDTAVEVLVDPIAGADLDAAMNECPQIRPYWISELSQRTAQHPALTAVVAHLTQVWTT